MSVSSCTSSLREIVALAQSGQRTLAQLELRQYVLEHEAASEDPAAGLWMAWLATSPEAMSHVIAKLLERDPHNELAQAGAAWARGLSDIAAASQRESAFGEFGEEARIDTLPMEFHARVDDALDTVESLLEAVQGDFGAAVVPSLRDSWVPLPIGPTPLQPGSSAPAEDTAEPLQQPVPADLANSLIELPADHVEDQVIDEQISSLFNQLEFHSSKSTGSSDFSQPYSNPVTAPPDRRSSFKLQSSCEIQQASCTTGDDAGRIETQIQDIETAIQNDRAFRDAEPLNQTGGSPGRGSQLAQATVLVVDDSPDIRMLLTTMLTQSGYGVCTAEDGLDAVKKIAMQAPDLIITDLSMPRMDGYKLCKLVGRSDKTRHIPVIMLASGLTDRLRSRFCGFTDYLTKPITLDSLLAVVDNSMAARISRSSSRF